MDKIKSNLDLKLLLTEIGWLDFKEDGSGAKMAFKPSGGLPDPKIWGMLTKAHSEIATIRGLKALHLGVNILPPKVDVPFHRDYLNPSPEQGNSPCLERWHLPIVTNNDCYYDGNGDSGFHMELGYWYGPIEYWRLHRVGNLGTTTRIHLIVDLDSKRIGNYVSNL